MLNARFEVFAVSMRLFYCLIVMSRSCLMILATAAAVPHNSRRMPTGFYHFYHHRPPLLRGCRSARACDPIVTFKYLKRKGSRSVLLRSSLRRESGAARTDFEMMVDGGDGGRGAPLPDGTLRNVIVTGANRGLGFAIADRMLALGGYRVVLACRSQREGDDALKRLKQQQQQGRQQHQCRMMPTDIPASVHPLDVSCSRSLEAFRENCVNGHLGGRVDILFNNAGVCLPEEVEKRATNNSTAAAAAAGTLRETLEVNFFGALGVVDACLPALMTAATVREEEIATTAEEQSMTRMMSLTPTTVVWISSGEGELCFLGAKWRKLLTNADSLEEIKSHMSDLLASASATENNRNNSNMTAATRNQRPGGEEEQEEMAFGPTPAYSLSKAAANAAVRTWAPRLLTPTAAATAATSETGETSTGGGVGGVRLVAVCPGDVLTRMTSKEELARGDTVSPEEAAVAVVDTALSSAQDLPTGRFYRHGEEIGW